MACTVQWRLVLVSSLLFAVFLVSAFDSITVLPTTCDDLQPRLEIRELAQDRDLWEVFLLGLKRMQEAKASDPTSYHAIASIHSWPNKGAKDVPRCQGCSDSFCPHNSHIFAIWHRPYLALFERALRKHALAAASEFSSGAVRRRYIAAARTLRLPYWDWAKPTGPGDEYLPWMFTNLRVSVQLATGRTEIDNPLYHFDFGENPAPALNLHFASTPHSTRYPINDDKLQTSRQDLAIAGIRSLHGSRGENIQCTLYKAITSITNYNKFAGSAGLAQPSGHDPSPDYNLESIHDDIHNYVGGTAINNTTYGTMYYLQISAFDPIFWMHHAMVDRMLTMFQVINPDSWIMPQRTGSLWTISSSDIVNGDTALAPFYRGNSSAMWTANLSRDAASFCYYYSDVDSQDSSRDQVIGVVNDLYGVGCVAGPASQAQSSTPTQAAAVTGNGTGLGIAPRTIKLPSTGALARLAQTVHNLVTNEGAVRDYVVNIQMDSMAMGDSPTVYIFDGPVQDDSSTWEQCSSFIGRRTFLTKIMPNGGEAGYPKRGAISLNDALIHRVKDGRLGGMGRSEVTCYLREHMYWKVIKSDGCVLDNEQVPGLLVSVFTADVQPAASREELPSWNKPHLLSEITAGKCGGYSAAL